MFKESTILRNYNFSSLKHSDVVFNLLINAKLPTAFDILTFISKTVELSMKFFFNIQTFFFSLSVKIYCSCKYYDLCH